MTHAPRNDSTEQRRRLLKGALGASTVVTLGYGAPAAAASLGCVANVRENGGYPTEDYQITTLAPDSSTRPDNGPTWAWKAVSPAPDVFSYQVPGQQEFEGFTFEGKVYRAEEAVKAIEVPGATRLNGVQQPIRQQLVWVLVYFADDGTESGTYPGVLAAEEGATPAQQSCLASLTPGGGPGGAPANYTYGG